MKKQSFTYLILACLISSTYIFVSQTHGSPPKVETLVLEIPFEFHVGEEKFGAGSYKLEVDPSSSLITLTNGDDEPKRVIGAISNGREKKNKVQTLVFHKYGDQHFLRKINAATQSSNLKKSKAEQTAKKTRQSGVKVTKVTLKA